MSNYVWLSAKGFTDLTAVFTSIRDKKKKNRIKLAKKLEKLYFVAFSAFALK